MGGRWQKFFNHSRNSFHVGRRGELLKLENTVASISWLADSFICVVISSCCVLFWKSSDGRFSILCVPLEWIIDNFTSLHLTVSEVPFQLLHDSSMPFNCVLTTILCCSSDEAVSGIFVGLKKKCRKQPWQLVKESDW